MIRQNDGNETEVCHASRVRQSGRAIGTERLNTKTKPHTLTGDLTGHGPAEIRAHVKPYVQTEDANMSRPPSSAAPHSRRGTSTTETAAGYATNPAAAMSLWLTEQGIDHDRVFCDTGWEHPDTYVYLRGELTRVLGPIVEVRAAETLAEMAIRKGMFPSRRKRWCTDRLKFEPLRAHIRDRQDAGNEVVNAVGVRGAESAARAAMVEWEWNDGLDCETWRPALTWTFDDVVALHRRHGLAPNPLYLRGAERVGCFPCIHAGRGELQLMARIWPERVNEIRILEAAVEVAAREKVEARGEVLIHPRTLLRERRPGVPAGIDAQMAWAGAAEPDLFYEDEPGCMRWGLCDVLGGTSA